MSRDIVSFPTCATVTDFGARALMIIFGLGLPTSVLGCGCAISSVAALTCYRVTALSGPAVSSA